VYLWHRGTGGFAIGEELLHWCPTQGCTGLIDPGFVLTEEEQREIPKEHWNDPSEWPFEVRRRQADYRNSLRMCPKCKALANARDLPETMFFQCSYQDLSDTLDEIWVATKGRADIFKTSYKHAKGFKDARRVLGSGHSFATMQSALEKAREVELAVYECSSLIRDLSNGSTVSKRVEAFLKA